MFAEQLKQERKRAEQEAKMTPEAIAKAAADKEAKRIATNAKAAATRAANKARKQQEAKDALNRDAEADQNEQQEESGSDTSASESSSSDESDISMQPSDHPDEEEEEKEEDDDENLEIYFAHCKEIPKRKSSKADRKKQQQIVIDKMKKRMVQEVTAKTAAAKVDAAAKANKDVAVVNQAVAAVTPVAVYSSNLVRLQEAYRKMVEKILSKFTVEFKTEVSVGALVCLKVMLLFCLLLLSAINIILCYACYRFRQVRWIKSQSELYWKM